MATAARDRYLPDGAAARDLLRPLLDGLAVERLAVAHLADDGRLLGVRVHDGGQAGRLCVPVRALLADALALDARRMIVAHNHPSGSARFSRDDIAATAALARIVGAADITLVDHLVFAGSRCESVRALGLL